jgi:hypothetical protein
VQMEIQIVRNLNLFDHYFKVLSFDLEARIWIPIRIKVKGRIRIRSNVMRIRNTGSESRLLFFKIGLKAGYDMYIGENCSVADPKCFSRILTFIYPGSRIPDPKTGTN